MSCDECGAFDYGDVVEHKMNTNIFGIVIGFMGSLVCLRVSPTLEVLSFHEWELRLVEGNETPPAKKEPTPGVIVNFADYLRSVKPQGRA